MASYGTGTYRLHLYVDKPKCSTISTHTCNPVIAHYCHCSSRTVSNPHRYWGQAIALLQLLGDLAAEMWGSGLA